MAEPFGQLSDREILVQIATDVGMLKTAVFGDKRPGLQENMAAVVHRLDAYDVVYAQYLRDQKPIVEEWTEYKLMVDQMRNDTPNQKERKAVFGSIAAAIGLALAAFVQSMLGGSQR